MNIGKSILYILVLLGFPLTAQNLIPNPGFEEGIDKDHTLVAKNGSEVVFSGTSTDQFEGDSALQIDVSFVATGGPQVIGVTNLIEGLETGKKYILRAAIKGPAGMKFRFRVAGDSKQTVNLVSNSDNYQVYEFHIDALGSASDGDHLVAVEFGSTDNPPGTWYVDNFELEKVDDNSGGDPGGGTTPGSASTVYISPSGADANNGSRTNPVQTLNKALELLGGDTIYLMEGRYHDAIDLIDFSGEEGIPKVITAVPGHEVIFDGTVPIESPWELHEGNIYKTTLTEDIWQVFVNGEMLNLCRWPNVDGFIEDEQPVSPDPLPKSLWDQHGTWGHSADHSTNGHMIDDGAKGLGASGLDMTGATAILNVGSFKTSTAPVQSHIPGEDQFTYDISYTDPFLTWQKPKHAYYFLEGKLNLLDTVGEWFYDKSTNELYIYTKDGSDPSTKEVKGKTQSYAMTFANSNYVEIRDIHFFGTTIKGSSCKNLTIENCSFTYPSYSKRILGDFGRMDITQFITDCENFVFRNNRIQYTEGEALHLEGNGSLMENNLMRHIDFSCANLYMLGGTVNFKSEDCVFRNNTIYIAGASETLAPGSNNTVEGNDIWGIGHLQNDGSMVQYMVSPAIGSVTRYNWLHDCKKSGMRYDGSLDVGNTGVSGYWEPWGKQTKGQVYKNVIWNTPTGLMIKGDYHVIVNNTVVENSKVGIIMMNPPPDGANHHSVCRNNISGMISGHRGGRTPDEFPIPGDHSHNWNGFFAEQDFRSMLVDYENRDFRPINSDLVINSGSSEVYSDDLFPAYTFFDSTFDIGAYEYGDTLYNIPGRREEICSHPIPFSGSTSKSDDLMLAWRPAYKAEKYRLFMGKDSALVTSTDADSDVFIGEQKGNVYIPGPMFKGEKVFWRIDALRGDEVRKGETWSFTVGENANGAVEDTISNIEFLIFDNQVPLSNAELLFNGEIFTSGSEGAININDQLIGETYTYSLSVAGFEELSGSFILDMDTTIVVTLIPVSSGMNDFSKGQMRVYPNPANDQVYISNTKRIGSLLIISELGSVVMHQPVDEYNTKVNVSTFGNGFYMIQLTDSNGTKSWEKLIIQH